MAEAIALAGRHSDGRILAVLEGGYHPQALARCVADAIAALDATPGSTVDRATTSTP